MEIIILSILLAGLSTLVANLLLIRHIVRENIDLRNRLLLGPKAYADHGSEMEKLRREILRLRSARTSRIEEEDSMAPGYDDRRVFDEEHQQSYDPTSPALEE